MMSPYSFCPHTCGTETQASAPVSRATSIFALGYVELNKLGHDQVAGTGSFIAMAVGDWYMLRPRSQKGCVRSLCLFKSISRPKTEQRQLWFFNRSGDSECNKFQT